MRTLLLVALVTLALPAAAAAQTSSGLPPGLRPVIPTSNSGADQYVESIPTADGNRSTIPVAGGPSSASNSAPTTPTAPLPAATQSVLATQGPDGAAAAALAQSTAPAKPRRTGRGAAPISGGGSGGGSNSGGGGTATARSTLDAAGAVASPTSSVLRSLTGADGGGGMIGLLAIVSVAAAIVVGVRRARAS